MISNHQGPNAEFMLANVPAEDISRQDCVRRAIERAFPLPLTGAFTDLLAVIDAGAGCPPKAASTRNLPGNPSALVER